MIHFNHIVDSLYHFTVNFITMASIDMWTAILIPLLLIGAAASDGTDATVDEQEDDGAVEIGAQFPRMPAGYMDVLSSRFEDLGAMCETAECEEEGGAETHQLTTIAPAPSPRWEARPGHVLEFAQARTRQQVIVDGEIVGPNL